MYYDVFCVAVANGGRRNARAVGERTAEMDKLCWACRPRVPAHEENVDPLAQMGENASQLMAALPIHSHHRAPLLSILSTNIPSTIASSLLHSSASYIRNAKKRDTDLIQAKYSAGVKRQKTAPERQEQLCEFIATACPTKSGERSVTHHQHTTDSSLYTAYCQSTPTPFSFHTFYLVKKWMRVRRSGRYLGQFDCSRCIAFFKLQHKPETQRTGEEAEELRHCTRHRETVFTAAALPADACAPPAAAAPSADGFHFGLSHSENRSLAESLRCAGLHCGDGVPARRETRARQPRLPL